MRTALVRLDPWAVVAHYADLPTRLWLRGEPNIIDVHQPSVGWSGPGSDGVDYALVAVVPFTPPDGEAASGDRRWSAAADGSAVETFDSLPDLEFTTWRVPNYTVIMRLEAAGKFAAALAALQADPLAYQRFIAVGAMGGVLNTDEPARALIAGLGLDPDVILARPD
jgi:hypothetical protein